MRFDVNGPYVIQRLGAKRQITDDSLSALRESIGDANLLGGCGCYVFALRASKGYTPWYVGQANKSRLLAEAMNPRNREIYNKVINESKGTPVLFLLPKLTASGKYVKPTTRENGAESINFLEEWLIATSLQKNPNLINQKKTFFIRNLKVTGLFNSGQGIATSSSTELKRAIY